MFTNLFLVPFKQGSQVDGRLKSSTPQLPQLPLLGETMLESLRLYGWEMLLGVWGMVRVCFAGPVAWFRTLHFCGSLSSHLDS